MALKPHLMVTIHLHANDRIKQDLLCCFESAEVANLFSIGSRLDFLISNRFGSTGFIFQTYQLVSWDH